jgi:Type II secretion system (T2SS), protein E, N-terminal domain
MATAHLNGSHGHGGDAVASPPADSLRREAPMPLRTRLLGELLVREGLVTETELSAALRAQEMVSDGTPIGQLLVERGALSPADLEAVLKRYHKKYRLGDILVETNTISETQLQLAVDHHRRTGLRLGDALLQLGFVNEETLKHALCTQLDVTFVDLDRVLLDPVLSSAIPQTFAQQHRVLPVAQVDNVLTVALADPTDGWVAENLETMTGCQVQLVMSTDTAFHRAFARVYGEHPGVGLARQHERLEQAHAELGREYQNAARALSELRKLHEDVLQDQAQLLRAADEQIGQQDARERRFAELQVAHVALRQEHEARGQAYAELARTQSDTLESLRAVRTAHGRLVEDHRELGRQLLAERDRSGELARRLAELETAHDSGRRELDERVQALTALDAAYAETTHALATLRSDHEVLRGEYERVSHQLRERCQAAEGRQQLAVHQLETLLARLRQ